MSFGRKKAMRAWLMPTGFNGDVVLAMLLKHVVGDELYMPVGSLRFHE